jgi:alkanesulfonate monooxygenase SsuD/methylene tetrahydromethanopterin reductase-like flavin-dependent oxidoreductase (luciferase family)
MFEAWTTLAAISQRTSRIKLGQMVGCAPYRNPGLLAKITSNIDVISGGRLIWGIGAGWYEHEFKGYGYDFLKPADRIRVLRETVEIVKALWSEPDVTYRGKHFTLEGAQCDPKPVQQPHPEILIGGGGEQLTLRVVARHADAANFGGKPHEWQHKAEVLAQHCKDIGRDYDAIRKTISPEVFIRETEREVLDAGSRSFVGEPVDSWRAGNLVGTPEQVAEKIQAYRALGCTGFYPWCSDYPGTETLRLFAQVAADLRLIVVTTAPICPWIHPRIAAERVCRRPSKVVPVPTRSASRRCARDSPPASDSFSGRRSSRDTAVAS